MNVLHLDRLVGCEWRKKEAGRRSSTSSNRESEIQMWATKLARAEVQSRVVGLSEVASFTHTFLYPCSAAAPSPNYRKIASNASGRIIVTYNQTTSRCTEDSRWNYNGPGTLVSVQFKLKIKSHSASFELIVKCHLKIRQFTF